jgi:hypothetical protein
MSINRLPSASSVLPRALKNSLPPPESGSPEAESRNLEAWAYNQFIFHGASDARAGQRCNWIESFNRPTPRGFDFRAIA